MTIVQENKQPLNENNSLFEYKGRSATWEELINTCDGKYLSRVRFDKNDVIVARFVKVKALKGIASIGFLAPNAEMAFSKKDVLHLTRTVTGFTVHTKSNAKWEIDL